MNMKRQIKALVVLSGGQDSVTCLGLARAEYDTVEAISFRYGQRHAIELDCAIKLCERDKIPHKIVDLGDALRTLVVSALTGDGEVGQPHAYKPNLPSSFVPGRNALFLTLAHAYAQMIGALEIITGVCQTDYSGYPDCRADFIIAMSEALNCGYQTGIFIRTPLMYLDKAQTFMLADRIGCLDDVLELSHTCYNGDHTTKHAWGYGCGACPACELRSAGWSKYQAAKSAAYVAGEEVKL